MSQQKAHNPFEIEVPKPGDIFVSVYESPRNLELVEGDPKARELSRQALKEVLKRIATIKAKLEAYRYFEAMALLEKHQKAEKLAKLAMEDAKERRDKAVFLKSGYSAKAHAKRIQQFENYVSPARETAIYLDRLEKRLTEHYIAVSNKKLYEDLRKQMKREVKFFGQTIIRRWSALGYSQKITRGNRTIVRRPQFEKCVVTEDEIQFKVAVKELSLLRSSVSLLPEGVFARDLVKPETLDELSAACERPITSPHETDDLGFDNGVFLVVNRVDMIDGLFNYVRLRDILSKYNLAHREKFPFPIGVKRGRVAKYAYLSEQPHIMVNGRTGTGKSNFFRVMLTCFIQYHSPQEFQMIITDLKRGSDLTFFEGVPHLYGDILHKIEDLELVVDKLIILLEHRMGLLKRHGVLDIVGFNALVGETEKMPRIALAIDECGMIEGLAEEKAQSYKIWKNLGIIATQARAAGIHLILGIQQSTGGQIPRNVADNISLLVSGHQRTVGASIGTFGDWRLKRMGNVKGRMHVSESGDEYLVQSPEAHTEDIKAALEVAKSYPMPIPLFSDIPENYESIYTRPFNEELILETVLNELNGEMKGNELIKILNHPEVSQRKVYDMLRAIQEKPLVEYDGKTYTVEVGKRNIRRLVETA